MMVYIPAMTLKAIHCHHYMPSGVANELQVVVSFFCHIVICFWIFFWSTPTASPSQPNPASLATSSLQVARVASWSTGAIWKWLREAYGLKAHWSAGTYICHLCNAKSAKNPCRWSRILGLYFNQIYFGAP